MILLVDNYDSFSYNLYQLVGSLDPDIQVIRNDAMTPQELLALAPSRIILSPGPGRPADAGVCEPLLRLLAEEMETKPEAQPIPVLGVCLGHQAICETFGGQIVYARELMHGRQSGAELDTQSSLFKGLPAKVTVGRYHSLAVREESLPAVLRITARADDGEVMAVEHTKYPVFGLQFHPESIMTPEGIDILKNFMEV